MWCDGVRARERDCVGGSGGFLVVDTRLRPNCLVESVDIGYTEPWKRQDDRKRR